MERKLTKLPHCQTEVIVTFSKEEWVDANKKAFQKEKANVTVKGFRKGKAPDNLVAEHIDQNKVMDAAINALLPVAYRAIVEEDKVQPFAQPQVAIEKLDSESLVVKFVVTTEPEIELGAYKDLKIGKTEVNVTDEQVTEAINKAAADNGTLVVVERPVKEGDTVIIDFTGYMDGKTFEGGSATNYELVIGSHYFIPGFEEQIIGHLSGDEFDVNVKFPEQYLETLAGKDGVFKVVLHEVKEKVLAEQNDDFAASLGIKGVETMDALKEHYKKQLTEEATNNAKRDYILKVINEILKNSKVDIPQMIVDDEVKARRENVVARMAQSGFTLEKYLEAVGQTEEDFTKQLTKEAETNINTVTVLKAVAAKENITADDSVLEFEFSKMAAQYNMKVEDVKKAIGTNLDSFRYQVLLSQAEDFLFNNNN